MGYNEENVNRKQLEEIEAEEKFVKRGTSGCLLIIFLLIFVHIFWVLDGDTRSKVLGIPKNKVEVTLLQNHNASSVNTSSVSNEKIQEIRGTYNQGLLARDKFTSTLDYTTAIFHANVEDMINDDSLKPGNKVVTKGYYSIDDGGGALYTIRPAGSGEPESCDNGSTVSLTNGNVAELITDGTVNIKQFGAWGDGDSDNPHDDTTAIRNAVSFGKKILIPHGVYVVTQTIQLQSHTSLCGIGTPTLKAGDTGGTDGFQFIHIQDKEHIAISDIILDGDIYNKNLTYPQTGIGISGCHDVTINRVTVKNCGCNNGTPRGNGIGLGISAENDCYNNTLNDCKIIDDSSYLAFGIRLYTSWTKAPLHYTRNNTIQSIYITGTYWNSIELAGPKTLYNVVTNIKGENITALTFVEADKGASYNVIENCNLFNYIGNVDGENICYRIQGTVRDGWNYPARGNTIKNCSVQVSKSYANTDLKLYTGTKAENSIFSNLIFKALDSYDTLTKLICVNLRSSSNTVVENCVFDYQNTSITVFGINTNVDVSKTNITNCIFEQTSTNGCRALQITTDLSMLSFVNNIVNGGQIAINVGSTNKIVDGIISNNRFNGQSSYCISLIQSGVKFKGIIRNNVFENIARNKMIGADDTSTFTDVNNVNITELSGG